MLTQPDEEKRMDETEKNAADEKVTAVFEQINATITPQQKGMAQRLLEQFVFKVFKYLRDMKIEDGIVEKRFYFDLSRWAFGCATGCKVVDDVETKE
jgi:hypothetical protein